MLLLRYADLNVSLASPRQAIQIHAGPIKEKKHPVLASYNIVSL